jgi:hypothetical protein
LQGSVNGAGTPPTAKQLKGDKGSRSNTNAQGSLQLKSQQIQSKTRPIVVNSLIGLHKQENNCR